MRLERAEVAGFGGLHDVRVVFHPGMTVIVGDNESGKSTLHRAIRAALYGIDAGGQGRAVERSDWARWAPWVPGPYGVALTYQMDDGRRIRVARRFDTREQPVQVLELGGSDLTDEVRAGRAVVPGRFHLGVDEAVFCATGWVSDDGLWLAAPEAPGQRADRLQEALERLADSRQGVTAAEAVERLRQAGERVGTERRGGSQLGGATRRLRELDVELDMARRRLTAVAGQQQRLLDLERAAAEADARRATAERAWLAGRISEFVERLQQLQSVADEAASHSAVLGETERYASFPAGLEEQVIAVGVELRQAGLDEAEAEARWLAADEPLRAARRRRAEIAPLLDAMGTGPQVDDTLLERSARLHGELSSVEAAAAAPAVEIAGEARLAALRQEIASTGLAALPPGSAGALGQLVATSRRGRAGAWFAAASAGVGAAAAGAGVLVATHRLVLALPVLLAGFAACAALVRAGVHARRGAQLANERLTGLAGRLGVDSGEIGLLSERLPALDALHAALLREQARSESRRAELDALRATAAALAERCTALAHAARVSAPVSSGAATTQALLERARHALAGIDDAIALHRRRHELQSEDTALSAEEGGMSALEEEAHIREQRSLRLQATLRNLLAKGGLHCGDNFDDAVEVVRHAGEQRRRHDEAARGLAEAQRRATIIGAEPELRRALDHLNVELRSRGGDPEAACIAPRMDAGELHRLELEAEHARQAATAAGEQARDVRARLAGVLDTLPDIADLEDERDACAAERDHALRRLEAIRHAIELLENASRRTHRDLAPRLAESVTGRLATLTDQRYAAVNVDTDHFAVALLCRDRPDMVPLELASHGTRDQVSLLLRLALCEVLSSSGEAMPLLLDEPVLTSDPRRRELMIAFLHNLSASHQVVLTTADPSVVTAVRDQAGDDATVVRLDGADAIVDATGRAAWPVPVLPA